MLVEELWEGDEVPRLARKTVQTYIYQLRKTIGQGNQAHPIVSQPHSYLCRVANGELDLWEFERLAAQGRDALATNDALTAAEVLHRAMTLWRGRALIDLEPGPLLSIEIRHLQDKFIKGLELRIDADLRLGRHREVVGELEALTARHPTHEAFYAHLMVAAYRSGHREDALRGYQRLRERLVDDLGLEPSGQLQQLHRDVLADALDASQNPDQRLSTVAISLAEIAPAHLPPDIGDFVGRESELRLLESCCSVGQDDHDRTDRTANQLTVVMGPPGVGKTTLAVRAAQRLRRRFPGGQLWASLHDEYNPPTDPATVLRGFLSAAGFTPAQIPTTATERCNLFRTWAADRELFLLLDDAATLDQVLPLLPAGGHCCALITSRNRLPGLPGVTTVQLGPIGVDEGVALLSDVVGAPRILGDLAGARAVVRACQGLPLAVRAAGEKLAARLPWPVTKLSNRLADPHRCMEELDTDGFSVRNHMVRAWLRLDHELRAAMARLCLFEERFSLAQAAGVLRMDPLDAEKPVGRLVECNLLAVVGVAPEGAAWFQFPELVRLAVLQRGRSGARTRQPITSAA
jgi:DNA-binding SARP family transcriptional activator